MNGSAAFRSHNWYDSLCTAGFAASSGFWLHQAVQPRLEPAVSSGQEVRVVSAALSWFPQEMVINCLVHMFRKVGSPGYLSFPCFSIAWGLATCLENCRYEGNVDDVDAKGPPVYKQILC